jgi:hypothetical protein
MRWRDLRAGDPVYNQHSDLVGEVTHADSSAVYIQLLKFREGNLTVLKGPVLSAPVARLGALIIRTTQ